MQQYAQRLRYDRPSTAREPGRHYTLTEDLSGYTLHAREEPDPIARMTGVDTRETAVRIDPDRAAHWTGAIAETDLPYGHVGATTKQLHRLAPPERDPVVVAGTLPPAVATVIEDIAAQLPWD